MKHMPNRYSLRAFNSVPHTTKSLKILATLAIDGDSFSTFGLTKPREAL